MTSKKQKPFKRIGLKGCTQLTWPCMSCCYRLPLSLPLRKGRTRSSRQVFWLPDLPTSRPFPQAASPQWMCQVSSPVTAAGPLPNYTGFPIERTGTLLASIYGNPPGLSIGFRNEPRLATPKPLLEKPRQLCDRIPFPLHRTRGRAFRLQPCAAATHITTGGHPLRCVRRLYSRETL
jgi:hypothetical protein